ESPSFVSVFTVIPPWASTVSSLTLPASSISSPRSTTRAEQAPLFLHASDERRTPVEACPRSSERRTCRDDRRERTMQTPGLLPGLGRRLLCTGTGSRGAGPNATAQIPPVPVQAGRADDAHRARRTKPPDFSGRDERRPFPFPT